MAFFTLRSDFYPRTPWIFFFLRTPTFGFVKWNFLSLEFWVKIIFAAVNMGFSFPIFSFENYLANIIDQYYSDTLNIFNICQIVRVFFFNFFFLNFFLFFIFYLFIFAKGHCSFLCFVEILACILCSLKNVPSFENCSFFIFLNVPFYRWIVSFHL